MNSISICLEMTKSFESLVCRTKLTNVSSENMFKDLIAGHARELVNSQVQETTFWNILSYETFTFSKNVLCAKMQSIDMMVQTYSMENGGDITQDKHWYYLGQVRAGFCLPRNIFPLSFYIFGPQLTETVIDRGCLRT